MSDLSPHARAALAALREDTGSSGECERVRHRLAMLGIVSVSSAAVALSAAQAAASGVAAGAPTITAAAGSAAAPGAQLVTSLAGSAAASASGSAAGGTLAAAGVATKLVTLPLALKAGVAAALLASAAVLPLPAERASPPAARREGAAEQLVTSSAARRGRPQAGARAAPEPARADALGQLPPLAPAQLDWREPFDLGQSAAAPRRAPARRSGKALQLARAPSSSLAEESRLLAEALRALRQGDEAQARELLGRHESLYQGRALLARERERLRAQLARR